MLLDKKKEKIINNHKIVYNLYKELKKTLPIGYIKTRVSKGQKYSINKQSILTKLEKEKIKQLISPSKITKNLFYNKNIYLFSGDNEKSNKILNKFQTFKQFHKQISSNNDIDIKNTQTNNTKKNIYNNFITNSKNIKKLNINLNSKEDNDISFEINTNRAPFRSSTINNCIMKNNIFLPSITSRLKNKIPRYYRQSEGFLLEGIGKYSFKNICSEERNVNEYTNIDEDLLKKDKIIEYETIKLIKNNKKNDINGNIGNTTDNSDINLKTNNFNDIKNNFRNILNKYNVKANELKITGFKKIKKNLIK